MGETYTLQKGTEKEFKGMLGLIRKYTRDEQSVTFILPFDDETTIIGTYTQNQFLETCKILQEKEIEMLKNIDIEYLKENAPDLIEYYGINFIDKLNKSSEMENLKNAISAPKRILNHLDDLGEDTTFEKESLNKIEDKTDSILESVYNQAFNSFKNVLIELSKQNLKAIDYQLENIDETTKEIQFTVTDHTHDIFKNYFS